MSKPQNGVYAAVVTPYDATGENPSAEQLAACLQQLADRGCHGALLAGTTGEGPSLSVAQRRSLFQAAVEANSGLTLLAGTGAASLDDTVTLTPRSHRFEDDVFVRPDGEPLSDHRALAVRIDWAAVEDG